MFNLAMSALFYFGFSFFGLIFLKNLSDRRWVSKKSSKILHYKEPRLMPMPALLPAIFSPVLLITSVIGLTDERFTFEAQMSLYAFLIAVWSGILFLLVATRGGRTKW